MKIFLISTILLLLCSCSNDEPEQTTHIYSITKEQYEQQVKGHIWESNNGRFFDAQGNEHSTAGWLGGDLRIHIMKVEGDQYFEYFEPDRHMMDDKVHCSVLAILNLMNIAEWFTQLYLTDIKVFYIILSFE